MKFVKMPWAELALKKGEKTLRAWSAGWASGRGALQREPAVELRPADRRPALDLSILATDIDADVLGARRGRWLPRKTHSNTAYPCLCTEAKYR